MDKKQARLRRAKRSRVNVDKPWLRVFKTPNHIYATVFESEGNGAHRVVATVSTLSTTIKSSLTGDKTAKAKLIGKAIGEAAQKKGIKKVSFDRAGFKYHGRIKALADAARESGLEF